MGQPLRTAVWTEDVRRQRPRGRVQGFHRGQLPNDIEILQVPEERKIVEFPVSGHLLPAAAELVDHPYFRRVLRAGCSTVLHHARELGLITLISRPGNS